MIYKMRNWTWTQTNKRPGVIGKWIDDIVYQRIAPLILAELKRQIQKMNLVIGVLGIINF